MRFEQKYAEPGAAEIKRISKENSVSLLLAKALILRGITERDDIKAFLYPDINALHDPFLLPDMNAAKDRLTRAVRSNERICIYGDYDADGVCATAILLRFLKSLGADAFSYLPSRFTDGYGMSAQAIENVADEGAKLIVTVDNGVTALEEVRRCKELGIDVIVTDHHQCLDELPDCVAVVNAKRSDSDYPFPEICGAGVALKLVAAMGGDINNSLALAALATVADVVSLMDENRVMVAHGLKLIDKNVGLVELMRVSGSDMNEINSETLAFRLAPRLNAAGRMGSAHRALDLLLEDDPIKAHEIALELNEQNIDRQQEEQRIFKEAENMICGADIDIMPAILLYSDDWNPGVIGIVASKLVEKHHRPTILFNAKNGVLTGSGRSIPGVDIFKCLNECSRTLIRYGGHSQAAGMSLPLLHFDEFRSDVFTYLNDNIPKKAYARTYKYEMEAQLYELSIDNVLSLSGLAPHGEDNLKPVFLTKDVWLRDARRMGSMGNHLRAVASKNGVSLPLVAFGYGHMEKELNGKCDILYTADINTWLDQRKTQLRLCAVKNRLFFASNKEREKYYDDFFVNYLYNIMNNKDMPFEELHPDAIKPLYMTREEMGSIYREFSDVLKDGSECWKTLVSGAAYDKKTLALLVFIELDLLRWNEHGDAVEIQSGAEKTDLRRSRLYEFANPQDSI